MSFARFIATACMALALLAPAQTSAQEAGSPALPGPGYLPETSAELLNLIKNCEDDACMSYVSGAIGGIAVYAIIAEKPSPFCARGNVQTEDIRQAIVATIESTPQLENQHPALAILTAFGRYWPCLTAEQVRALQSTQVVEITPEQVDSLISSGGQILEYGNPEAGPDKTILVFHDPNCNHCRRFRNTAHELARRGWKVLVYPVATTTEESAGYGAVQIALRDLDQGAVQALYENDPEGTADITLATKLAEEAGVPSRDILTAIAKSGAYDSVEHNTRAFFEMGAKGAPSWIVGPHLYSGYLDADGVESVVSSAETGTSAPSSEEQTPPAKMEQ